MEHGEEGFSGIFAVFRLVASGDERAIFFFFFCSGGCGSGSSGGGLVEERGDEAELKS
jgi:hypothetical protein